MVTSSQKYQPIEDSDIDDDDAVPLNENASQVSFDNFEKENASEKKRKKIYLTQNEIQKLIDKKFDGLIINAAAFTHTSVAILDALNIIKIPKIEIHLSNIYRREEFRQKSLISKAVDGIICGFGVESYIYAIDAMSKIIKNGIR